MPDDQTQSQAPEIDLQELADKVYELLRRELKLERERLGLSRSLRREL